MRRILVGYVRTLWQYWQTPKGRHDILDDLQALGRIALGMGLAIALAKLALWLFSIFSRNA